MLRDAGDDGTEIGFGVDAVQLCRFDEGIHRRRAPAAVIRTGEGPVLSPDSLLIAGLFLLGCFEGFVLKNEAMAGLSWWICLLALTVWIMYPFTIVRICIGSAVFVVGIILMMKYGRWMNKRLGQQMNDHDRLPE